MVSRIDKWWPLSAFIVFAVLALLFAGNNLGSPGSAKAELQTGTFGNGEILVVPIQLERDQYGLAMVDMTTQTLWIYELNNVGPPHNRLRLLAARSWQYDRLLKQYNTAEPKPEQVRMLLEEQDSADRTNLSHSKVLLTEQQKNLDVNVADVNVTEVNEPNE